MKGKKLAGMLLLAALLALVFCAFACADAQSDILAQLKEDETTYAPQVRTLKNGVKIQRTPNTTDMVGNYSMQNGYYLNLYWDKTSYNMKYLDADRRGCGACHTDLASVATNLKGYPHLMFNGNTEGLEIDMNVGQCMICHNYSTGTPDVFTFGNLMHMLHDSGNAAFGKLGGDCWSCHYAAEDGQGMQLWDDVKYSVLRGITPLEADTQDMSFEWDQTTTIDVDDMYDVQWYFDAGGLRRRASIVDELTPDPEHDGIYDAWTIKVDGEVENPFEMTLTELIKEIPPVKATMISHCGDNMIGGPWIANVEVTGIPIKDILAYAGANPEAQTLDSLSQDGNLYNAAMSSVYDDGAYLVLEISGKPLPYRLGYPCAVWVGGQPAWVNNKEVNQLTVRMEPVEIWPAGLPTEDGVSYYKPNVGLCHFADGQIIPAGQSYTFEGYASAWDDTITAIEYSFDQGQTWRRFDTEGADKTRWVYWHMTWQPPEEGAYVLMIRSYCSDGSVTVKPLKYLVNVQAEEVAS